MSDKPTGAGKSSFDLVDQTLFLDIMESFHAASILDLGCGAGNYSIALAKRLGPEHEVYGVDLWEEGVNLLRERAAGENLDNLRAMTGNAAGKIPLPGQAVELILLGTVFHDFVADGVHKTALAEMKRVLAPEGGLAVVEFKKTDGPPGPPKKVRLSPGELEEVLDGHGFIQAKHFGLGEHVYLSLFRLVA